MQSYYLIFSLFLIFLIKYIPSAQYIKRRRMVILAVLFLSLIAGLRNPLAVVGSDIYNYYMMYVSCIRIENICEATQQLPVEAGYIILNWIIGKIIPWGQFIVILVPLICISICMWFISKYSCDVWLSIVIFVVLGGYTFVQTGFRQGLAIYLCMISIHYAINKKLILYLFFIALAVSFHQTAIIFAPMYYFINRKLNLKNAFYDIALSTLIGLLSATLISFGNELFGKTYTGDSWGNILGPSIAIFFYSFSIIALLRSSLLNPIINETPVFKFVHLLILGVCIYTFRFQSLILERVSFYFTPYIVIVLPYALKYNFTIKDYNMLKIVFALFLILLCWHRNNIPYDFFW